LSFAPGSEKEPSVKLVLAPSYAVWLAGAVTVGATFAASIAKVAEPGPPSLSVTVTVTV